MRDATATSPSRPTAIAVQTPSEIDAPFPEIIVRDGANFDWPPAPSGAIQRIEEPRILPKRSRLKELVDSIELTLLGRTALSFARRAAHESWTPDEQSKFCWRCAGSVGLHEADGEGCASCRNTRLQWDQAVRLGQYEGIIRDTVLDLKFHRWRTSGHEMGIALGHAIERRLERSQIRADEIVLVPIPISNRRRIQRGVDHTHVLARGASRVLGSPICRLLAAKHRPEQVGLSMTARGRNAKGSFRVRGDGLGQFADNCRAVVLIDDVRTTGATMTAAIKTLRSSSKDKKTDRGSEYRIEFWAATAAVAAMGAPDRQILKN